MNSLSQKELNKKISTATFWSSLTQIIAKIIPPITNMMLARLLAPEEFGIVATFTLVISFSDIFTDAGFQKYIVQHEFKDDKELFTSTNVAFWTNFIFSITIWIIIALNSNKLAELIGSPGCGFGITIACIVVPITAFSSVQQALLRRQFNFKVIFWVRLTLTVVPLIVTVPLAFVFRNYWALVIGTLIRELLCSVLLTVLSKWKPKLTYSISAFKQMFSFSVWTLLEQISVWFTGNVGIFIVANSFNQYYLGLYKTSIATVNSILTVVSAAVIPVLFAALSRVQDDDLVFKDTFYKFHRMLSVIILPMGIGCFVYRKLVTHVMLGSQWDEAIGFIGLCGLSSALSIMFNSLNAEAIRSKGKPKISLLIQLGQIVATVIGLLMASRVSFSCVCDVRAVLPIVSIIISSIVVEKLCGISFIHIIKSSIPAIASSVVMAFVGMVFIRYSNDVEWIQFLSIFACIIVYFVVLFVLFPSTKKEVLEIEKIGCFIRKIRNIGRKKNKK